MKLIKVALVLALVVAVLGFYRGWFSLSARNREGASQKVDVNLAVDVDKMREDAEQVKR